MTGGTIAAFVLYGGLLAGAIGNYRKCTGTCCGLPARRSGSRNCSMRNRNSRAGGPRRLPAPPRGELAFEHVTFHYPTRRETSALKDFSLTIKARERLAVVGPSVPERRLVPARRAIYDPDGANPARRRRPSGGRPRGIRQRIAMVPQETIIFAASARDNLRYGNWDASEDELWQAARDANAEEFFRALPEGLDTFMGEGGARLSGGQRQRIAIARALLRNAPLLLLDEATSALDAESERLVQDALDRLMEERTTIVIAHRLATVRAADRIVVMECGADRRGRDAREP